MDSAIFFWKMVFFVRKRPKIGPESITGSHSLCECRYIHVAKSLSQTLKNREDAIPFFREFLPPDVVGLLDLEQLQYLPESYLDPSFQEHRTDILYEIPTITGNLTRIALLFEHKSEPGKLTYLQLFRYLSRIYEKEAEEKGRPIPVIPFLFFHENNHWILDSNFSSLFDLSEEERRILGKYIPDFHVELFHVKDADPERVRRELHLFAFLSTIRHVVLKDLADHWPRIMEVSRVVFWGEKGLEELMKLVVFVVNKGEMGVEDLKESVLKIAPALEGEIMTTAERLRQEGRREGIQEGRQEGKQEGKLEGRLEVAKRMLEKGLPLQDIREITALSKEELKGAGLIPEK